MNRLIQKTFLPSQPGVYLFYNKYRRLIYVGKAANLRSRVASYFHGSRSGRPIEGVLPEVKKIDYRVADSLLEALLLEAQLIKKFQPIYNVRGKDDRSWQYLGITDDTYPKIVIVRERELEEQKFAKLFGPFPVSHNLKNALNVLRRIFHFSACTPKAKRPCLYYQMGECAGVCVGEISSLEYKRSVITPLSFFLEGKKKKLLARLKKEMRSAARQRFFEEAARLRDQVRALSHIQDVALLNQEFVSEAFHTIAELMPVASAAIRIEGYDISHLAGTGTVGSMVVFAQNGPVKSLYRKFKIRSAAPHDDAAAMQEVLRRRFAHSEWQLPALILVDGGKPQVNAASAALKELALEFPVVGIAKGPQRKKNEFILSALAPTFRQWVLAHRTLLIQVRDEAHRFAISFHRALRKKSLLQES